MAHNAKITAQRARSGHFRKPTTKATTKQAARDTCRDFALAGADGQFARLQIHVADVELAELGTTDAGFGQRADDATVAGCFGRVNHLPNLSRFQGELRRFLLPPRGRYTSRWGEMRLRDINTTTEKPLTGIRERLSAQVADVIRALVKL